MKENKKVPKMSRWLLSSKTTGKRALVFGLATVMVISMLPTSAFAANSGSAISLINSLDLSTAQTINLEGAKQSVEGQLQAGISQKDSEKESIDLDDDVVIIVDVEGDSLVDKFEESGEKDVNEFIDDNQEVKEEINDDVQEVADDVVNELKGNSEVVYTYDTLFTGAAISAKYGDLQAIRKMDGVERAYVARNYEVPEDQECDLDEVAPSMVTSREIMNTSMIQNNANLDFRGQGMVVAILDTGIAYKHEAFAKNPEEAAYTQEVMAQKIAELDLISESRFEGTLSADGEGGDNIFKSLKVPYGYDYNDNDTEITPLNSENHGTHVSGTVAGNSDTVQGIAPEAQLMGMKVFNDTGSTNDSVLFAALEDSVLLGADVINMSLGATCGFMVDENPMLEEVYATIEEQGINLDVSAGNEANSAENNAYGSLALTTNPDSGTVGSPATFHSALAIAAYENTYLNYCHYFTLADGTDVSYADMAGDTDATKTFDELPAGEYQYVSCGMATPEEVAAAGDLTGKIALVVRGALSFTDKVKNVADGNATAMILYNNEAGTINMSIDPYLVPAVSITQELGQQMETAIDPETKVGTISYDPTMTASFENPLAGKMCSFSSWGPAPDLTLKPEITAPGGNIYSSYWVDGEGNSVYGMMSGTSMSCPHMSGASAVVKQYVKEKYPQMEAKDVEYMVNCLLMSTAKPVIEGLVSDGVNTNYYSPRVQGSGLADVYAAVTSKSYLSVDGCERPKAEVGANKNGKFTYYTTINNTSDEELTYDLSGAVQIEDYGTTESGISLSTMTSTNGIGDWATMKFTGSRVRKNTVVVPANSSVEIRVKVSIDKENEELKQYMMDHPNGFYVDGFTFIENEEESLSLPFLGFCGDWATPPTFEPTIYDDTAVAQTEASLLYNDVSGLYFNLGTNLLKVINDEDDITYHANQVSISPNSLAGITSRLATMTYTLRNTEELEAVFRNANGKKLNTTTFDYIPKTHYFSDYQMFVWVEGFYDNYPVFTGFDENGNAYKDGQYSLTWSALPLGVKDNKKHTDKLTYNFTLDAEAPAFDMDNTMLFELDGTMYLYVKATDNDYLAGWQVIVNDLEGTGYTLDTKYFNHELAADGTTTESNLYVLGTKADFVAAGLDPESISLDLYDWAMNLTSQEVKAEHVPSASETTICSVENTTYNEITVNWDLSDGATGYKILRSTSENGKYKVVENIKDGGTTSFTDNGEFKLNSTYFYKVRPYAKGTYMGEPMTKMAKASPAVGVTVVIPKATRLQRATATFLGCTILKWQRVSGVTGYEVVRSSTRNGDYTTVRTVKGSRYVGCIDLESTVRGQSYFYKVRPYVEKDGEIYYGEYSNIKKVTARRSFGSVFRFFQ